MSITETPTVESIHQQHYGSATSEHHSRLPSKRKFDDCDGDDEVSARMKKDTVTTSSRLQFFVRVMSEGNSLVIQAWGEETVESVHERIERMTGIPVRHQRLIYKGKQLGCEESLEECGIENEASVQLVGHLQSGGSPAVWQVMDSMVSFIYRLCRGEFVHDAFRNILRLMTLYINKPDYFSAFLSLKAPSVLVTLYVSPYAGNRALADSAIRYFLGCCRSSYSTRLQDGCLDVVLEFCRLLRRVGGNDPLYAFCRGGFTSLLETLGGGVCFWNPTRRVLLQGVFSFVRELADGLLRDLDLSMVCLPAAAGGAGEGPGFRDVHDFAAFLVHLRNGIRRQQGLGGSVVVGNRHRVDPLIAGVLDQLRVMYAQLLSKMDECLHRMEDCLENKKQEEVEGEGEGDWDGGARWSQYLSILKELYQISKLYDGAEEKFWTVLSHRRSMLSQLIIRYAKRTDDYQWVLEHKTVTNFESRRHLAMMLFPEVKDDFGEVHEMFIDRSKLLAESFKYIARADPESLQGGLFMEFKNEDASGPGVLREWFILVCQAIFNPQNDLFVACPNDRRRFFPNPASKVHPRHLEYFSFCGRIIALALMNRVQVGIVFDRVFLMQLAGNYITLEDIRDADPTLYSSWKQILEMDADIIDSDALGLTFVREVEELGYRKVIELCPGGKSLVVNSKNREKYVDLLIQNYFVTSISEQVSHFAKGFTDIISSSRMRQFFQILELEDLDWMLHGSENAISVEDWKAHTEYNGYKETDCQISWFWEIVGGMSAEQRKVLLFFWTSVKYLPVEGFHGLASRLYISKSMEPDDRLPSSHTCFYQLSFPPYSSMAIMQDRLGVITQEHISCSFGTW